MSQDMTGLNKRRRRRIPISCSVCRQRKLKCDKEHPCNSCVLRGTVALCSYAERPWLRNTDGHRIVESAENGTATENKRLREENRKLRSLLDSINSQASSDSVEPTHSEQSQFSSSLKYGMIGNKKSKQVFVGPFTPFILCFNCPEIMNIMRCAKQQFKAVSKKNGLSGHSPHDRLKALRAKVTEQFSYSSLGRGKEPAYKTLVDSATRFLPPIKSCRLLIDRFFSHVYTLYALLDPYSFHQVQDDLLEFSSLDERFEKNSSLIDSFALLFIILLLARMSLLDSTTDLSLYEGLDLVDAHYTTIAETLLLRNGNLKKSGMTCLSALVYIRLCRQVTLQEGDGGDGSDSDIFCGIIFHSASSMGLHRDPRYFADISPHNAYLWRKLWAVLLLFDTKQSLELGRPLTFHSSWYDTLEPTSSLFIPQEIRGSVLEKEEEALYSMSLRSKSMLIIRHILEQLSSVTSFPSAEMLVSYVDQIDEFCLLHYSALHNSFSDDPSYEGLSSLEPHLRSTSFIESYSDILKVKINLLARLSNSTCGIHSSNEPYTFLHKLSSTAQQLSLLSIKWIEQSKPGDRIWLMVPCAILNVRFSTCFLIWLMFRDEGYKMNDKTPDHLLLLPDIIEKTICFLEKFPDSFSAHKFLFLLPEILKKFKSKQGELRDPVQTEPDVDGSSSLQVGNWSDVPSQDIHISDDWINEIGFWQDYLNF